MKIYFIGPLQSTFVQYDISVLKENHTVICENSGIGTGAKAIFKLIKLAIKAAFNMASADMFFGWFGDYATFAPTLFAKIFGKKSIVIAGGFDVGYIPELEFGAKYKKFRWFCVKNTFLMADKIVTVSDYTSQSLFNLTGVSPNKVDRVYSCIVSKDYDVRDLLDVERKYFITSSQAYALNEFKRKGSDKFIDTARRNPDKDFILTGLRGAAYDEAMRLGADLKNLKILKGPLKFHEEIIPLYKQSYGYIQLSIEETFGLSVIEAMRCGCLPIVSTNGALVEVTAQHGLICNSNEDIDKYLDVAIKASAEYRKECSEYSLKFDVKYKREGLNRAIDSLS